MSRSAEIKTLTVVCSVYNEEATIPLFYERVAAVFADLGDRYRGQVFFVDNGSTDASLDHIRKLAARDPAVFCGVLSRNFGYQCAIEYALRESPGDLFVTIDVDCEDPPEMIVEFLAHYEAGFDIVYGERVDRPEFWLLKFGRKVFYRLIRAIADDNFVLDMAEFALITAEVRDAIVLDNNSFPFMRSSIGRIGFKRKNVPYSRHSRIAGETHYNLLGLMFFATAGILSASTLPLRLATYAFPLWLIAISVLGVLHAATAWAWAVPLLLVLGFAYCGFALAAIGLYVARIYKNGLNRPNVIVRPQLSILPSEHGSYRAAADERDVLLPRPPVSQPAASQSPVSQSSASQLSGSQAPVSQSPASQSNGPLASPSGEPSPMVDDQPPETVE